MSTLPVPRYYCPPGIEPPASCMHRGGTRLAPGKGPDVDAARAMRAPCDGMGGGLVFGGLFIPGEPGWVPTAGGWWLNLSGTTPQWLVRMDTSPRIRRWAQIPGALPDQTWRVPVLLTPNIGDERGPGATPGLYVSALDHVWRGDHWETPAEFAELQRRLLDVAVGLARTGNLGADNIALVQTVVDVLAIGHSVGMDECSAGGWISGAFALRVLMATADIPIAARSAPAIDPDADSVEDRT